MPTERLPERAVVAAAPIAAHLQESDSEDDEHPAGGGLGVACLLLARLIFVENCYLTASNCAVACPARAAGNHDRGLSTFDLLNIMDKPTVETFLVLVLFKRTPFFRCCRF